MYGSETHYFEILSAKFSTNYSSGPDKRMDEGNPAGFVGG